MQKRFLSENDTDLEEKNNRDIIWNIARHNERIINRTVDTIDDKVWKHIFSNRKNNFFDNDEENVLHASADDNIKSKWNKILKDLKDSKKGIITSKIFFIFQCVHQFDFVTKHVQKRCPDRNRFLFLIEKIHEAFEVLKDYDNINHDFLNDIITEKYIERGIIIEQIVIKICAEYVVEFEDSY